MNRSRNCLRFEYRYSFVRRKGPLSSILWQRVLRRRHISFCRPFSELRIWTHKSTACSGGWKSALHTETAQSTRTTLNLHNLVHLSCVAGRVIRLNHPLTGRMRWSGRAAGGNTLRFQGCRLRSRNLREATAFYPDLVEALSESTEPRRWLGPRRRDRRTRSGHRCPF